LRGERIILSVWLFDERFTESPPRIAIAAVAMAVLVVGVISLSRTAPEDLKPSRASREERPRAEPC
jgi:hypothetical protein